MIIVPKFVPRLVPKSLRPIMDIDFEALEKRGVSVNRFVSYKNCRRIERVDRLLKKRKDKIEEEATGEFMKTVSNDEIKGAMSFFKQPAITAGQIRIYRKFFEGVKDIGPHDTVIASESCGARSLTIIKSGKSRPDKPKQITP